MSLQQHEPFLESAMPPELAIRLINLEFYEDFKILGISVDEALKLDIPSLARLINEKTGVVEDYTRKKEQETLANNKKFHEDMRGTNRILF